VAAKILIRRTKLSFRPSFGNFRKLFKILAEFPSLEITFADSFGKILKNEAIFGSFVSRQKNR